MHERSGLKVVSAGKLTAWGQSLRWLAVIPIWAALAILMIQSMVESSFSKFVIATILTAVQFFWMYFPAVPIRTFAIIAWVFRQ